MGWLVALELVASLLAVLGVFLFVRYVSEVYFLPREIVNAIIIFDDESRKNIDLILNILRNSARNQINRPIMVFVSEKYSNDAKLFEMIAEAGVEYHIVKDK